MMPYNHFVEIDLFNNNDYNDNGDFTIVVCLCPQGVPGAKRVCDANYDEISEYFEGENRVSFKWWGGLFPDWGDVKLGQGKYDKAYIPAAYDRDTATLQG